MRAGGIVLLIPYFGGAGVNTSRLRPGSGLGLGLGAFFTSFLPLSLLPMAQSMTQKGAMGKVPGSHFNCFFRYPYWQINAFLNRKNPRHPL
jgi:hypothetical protein